jgi:hypothetical protein
MTETLPGMLLKWSPILVTQHLCGHGQGSHLSLMIFKMQRRPHLQSPFCFNTFTPCRSWTTWDHLPWTGTSPASRRQQRTAPPLSICPSDCTPRQTRPAGQTVHAASGLQTPGLESGARAPSWLYSSCLLHASSTTAVPSPPTCSNCTPVWGGRGSGDLGVGGVLCLLTTPPGSSFILSDGDGRSSRAQEQKAPTPAPQNGVPRGHMTRVKRNTGEG